MQQGHRRPVRASRPDKRGIGLAFRALAVFGLVGAVMAGTAASATTDTGTRTGGSAGVRIDARTGGVLAEYDGRTIDLSQSWEGAETCVEQDDGAFVCYADDEIYRAAEGIGPEEEAVADTLAEGAGSCTDGYFCLWDDQHFNGRKVQYQRAKLFDLGRVGFRNRANSMFNNRPLRWTTFMHDDECGGGTCSLRPVGRFALPVLSHVDRSAGGTWNDKIDVVALHNDENPPPTGGAGWSGRTNPPRPRGDDSGDVIAEYNGRKINLAQDWEGADTCVEQDDGGFVCHDDPGLSTAADASGPSADSGVSPLSVGECRAGYFCLWDARHFKGRKVQFKTAKAHDLRNVGFRNRANTMYNARSSDTVVVDERDDGSFGIHPRYAIPALGMLQKIDDGDWNNKIDVVILESQP